MVQSWTVRGNDSGKMMGSIVPLLLTMFPSGTIACSFPRGCTLHCMHAVRIFSRFGPPYQQYKLLESPLFLIFDGDVLVLWVYVS